MIQGLFMLYTIRITALGQKNERVFVLQSGLTSLVLFCCFCYPKFLGRYGASAVIHIKGCFIRTVCHCNFGRFVVLVGTD